MDHEREIAMLSQKTADLEARREASEAVIGMTLALLLALYPSPALLLAALRQSKVQAAASHGGEVGPAAENMRLKIEQYVQDFIDRIERTLSAVPEPSI